jgi:hypothetical protein
MSSINFVVFGENDAKLWSKGRSRVSIFFMLHTNLTFNNYTKLTQKCPLK